MNRLLKVVLLALWLGTLISNSADAAIKLNEVLASNHSLTNRDGSTSDWIELFNPSTTILDLGDQSLTDDPNVPRKFVFTTGTKISAKGFLQVYCNDKQQASANNSGFALSANGGSVYLFDQVANGGGLLDSVTFGLQVADFSIGCLPDGSGAWTLTVPSPNSRNVAAGLGTDAGLSINEWMAAPASGSDWFELYQSGSQPVSLGGLYFTDDLTQKTMSPIPGLSFIGTGANGFFVFQADGNLNAGADHVKFKLSKSGATIGLFSSAGSLITAVSFGAQQTGISQGRFPDGANTITNFITTVTPGESNFLPFDSLVINEILTHTDPPLEDAIEFYNAGSASVDLSGWFLSNSKDNLKKYRIAANTSVTAHGFKVLYEYQFNPLSGSGVPFTFNSAHGDSATLSQADPSGTLTGYRAIAAFGPAANGVSFGRYTNSAQEVLYLAANALSFGVNNPVSVNQFRTGTGAVNPYPSVGPAIISEIMFYPPLIGGTQDDTQNEYVELRNLTASELPLFNPLEPTNTWKLTGGIDFVFPKNVKIPAGGFILVVNFDPAADSAAAAAFRSKYGLSNAAQLFGPYGGHLSNSGETVALYKPDPIQLPPHPDAGFVPYVLVEEVPYRASSPWPAGADGSGASLQRLGPTHYANDPANWFVAAPTAARDNVLNPSDANGDGLPDAWQIEFFGASDKPDAAPGADPDGDGSSNLQEFWAGTNPTNSNSCFKISSVRIENGKSLIEFEAVTARTYSVLYSIDPSASSWLKLTNVAAQPVDHVVQVTDPAPISASPRFYRLLTPQLP